MSSAGETLHGLFDGTCYLAKAGEERCCKAERNAGRCNLY